MAHRTRPWLWIAGLCALLPILIALAVVAWDALQPPPGLRGLSLGLTPSQARAAMEAQGPGRYRTETRGADLSLDWSPESSRDLREARLEFHDGQLVAVRMLVDATSSEASGPRLTVTSGSVLTRRRTDRGVQLTWLARNCPAHAEEVARALGGAP